MHDPATLAQEARRALAEAHTATLLVEGLGRVGPDHVLLDDRDGRPRFTCAAGSPVATAAAARCPAILDVGVPSSGTLCGGSVIFAGHLGVSTDVGAASTAGIDVVELHLVSVVVEIDDPHARSVVARRIPLEVYAAPVPAAAVLADAAETMRVHTNARHGDRLRSCAAARAGIEQAGIVAAELTAVGVDGADLQWLDLEGGHTVRLGFPRIATDGPDLAALLRAALCAHRRCS